MSNKKPNLSIEEIEKGVSYNKAIIKNLFIFYAVCAPICLVIAALMFFLEEGRYSSYGITLIIMFVLCTVYVVMAYVRRKRVLDELIRQENKKNKNK